MLEEWIFVQEETNALTETTHKEFKKLNKDQDPYPTPPVTPPSAMLSTTITYPGEYQKDHKRTVFAPWKVTFNARRKYQQVRCIGEKIVDRRMVECLLRNGDKALSSKGSKQPVKGLGNLHRNQLPDAPK